MGSSRAKFYVTNVEEYDESINVDLEAVTYDDDKENQEFNKYTPGGNLSMMIDNPNLFGFFEKNAEYYLDFTKVEK